MTVVDRPTISEQFFGRFHASPIGGKRQAYTYTSAPGPGAPVDRRGRWLPLGRLEIEHLSHSLPSAIARWSSKVFTSSLIACSLVSGLRTGSAGISARARPLSARRMPALPGEIGDHRAAILCTYSTQELLPSHTRPPRSRAGNSSAGCFKTGPQYKIQGGREGRHVHPVEGALTLNH
jgi:hypothetical protein